MLLWRKFCLRMAAAHATNAAAFAAAEQVAFLQRDYDETFDLARDRSLARYTVWMRRAAR